MNTSEESLITTQLKIMEVGPPLIDLYTRILAFGEKETQKKAKDIAQNALQR